MKIFQLVVISGLLGGGCASAQADAPPYVAAALADPARGHDTDADPRRHPGELAVFAGIKPGDTVVDLIPGSGYFTRVFSQIVGPNGHVYAIWPDEYAKVDGGEVAATEALARDPHYANVTILKEPAAKFSVPVAADVVWTSQNYHDYPISFMGPVDPSSLDAEVFAALKPGGAFVVIDHVAEPGSGLRDTDAMHRIDPELVNAQVTGAGFKLEAESSLLRSSTDRHRVIVFDRSIRGHTDQFAFRFRKASAR